jgi:hypothetical protein
MKNSLRAARLVAVWMACLGWLLPAPTSFASNPPANSGAAKRPVVDVRLATGGTLAGKLVDASGQPLGDRVITLHQAGRELTRVKTDAQGDFVFRMTRGGAYQMTIDDRAVNCRVWAPTVAPPSARDRLLIVTGSPVVRGQQPIGAVFSNPLFVGAVVAAAIAIPVAVHNSQNDEPPGS